MAVHNSAICKQTSQDIMFSSCTENETNRCESAVNNLSKSQQHKKEQKKPELQRYRPGMGLQNKNNLKSDETTTLNLNKMTIKDETCNSPSSNKDLTLATNESDSLLNEFKCTASNGSKENKSNKSRRPDQKVYMARHKVLSNLKDSTEEKRDEKKSPHKEHKRTSGRSSVLNGSVQTSEIKYPISETVSNGPSMKQVRNESINVYNKSNKSKNNSNRNLQEESWSLSSDSSRSTPDGFPSERSLVLSESLNFVNSNLQHNKIRMNVDAKSKTAKSVDVSNHGSVKNVIPSSTCWGDTEYEFDNAPEYIFSDQEVNKIEKSEKNVINKKSITPKESILLNERRKNNTPDIILNGHMESGKNAKNSTKYGGRERKISEKEENSHRNKLNNVSHSVLRDKSGRKAKRDRGEQLLPPRFQKQNRTIQDSKSETSEVKSGGILVVPPDSLTGTIQKTPEKISLYSTSPVQHSPTQIYVHKQLFNPKNPKSPEIVNIPAPGNIAHFDSSNYSADYMPKSESLNYGASTSATNINKGYIPPPQQPTIRSPYQISNADMSLLAEGLSGNIVPPVLCPSPLSNVRMMPPSVQPPIYRDNYILPPESEKKRLKPIVEKNLKEISLLERELNSHLAKSVSMTDINALRQCRWKLQLRYENIILADPRYCAEKNAEQHLWKSAYYQIIEALRKNLEEQPQNKELKENLLNLVNEGTVFYENLLEKQQETYGFNLSKLLELETTNGTCFPESLRLVLISSQKLLIYLGDLARYREQASGATNFGRARNWYLKAQKIAPKNGRPYHQLAVLALCAKRKLDAVYYFIRSLAASNPFLSAREYLLSLFEDAKKKYEKIDKKRKEDLASEREIISQDSEERSEIWIKPDGTTSHRSTVLEEDHNSVEFRKLSNVELNKRFVTSFLHVHGKLFTKVGMETFNEILLQMLKEFNCLLQRIPMSLESSRLLQLSAINMYAVANASLRDNNFEEEGYPLLLIQALQVSQAMMSLIIQRCCVLLKLHIESSEYPKILMSHEMAHLFPAVKIWADWMSCQQELWSEVPLLLSDFPNIGLDLDVWSSFADLLTCLIDVDISTPEIAFERRKEGFECVVLEEDSILSGFVPMLGALQDPSYAMAPFDKDRAKQCVRISRVQFFGDYLCGISTPYLEFDVKHKRFVSLVAASSDSDSGKTRKDLFENHKDDSFGDDSLESDDILLQQSPDDEGSSEIKILWSRKEALCRVKARQEKYQAQVQDVLQKNQRQRPISFQIHPRYLIPDTNCFIDHLHHLKNILETATFSLVVPLVVINELDGLARGTRPNPYSTPEHANEVTALSRASVTFLEEQFAARNPRLRAITSKGSVLDTISFRVEEVGHNKRGNNDDLILSCCLYYCKDRAEMYMPKNQNEPLQLMREVVLLTDDRNLRVKALTHNVPARDLVSFLQWVNS